ncbi:MAG: hypothetical protein KTR16_10075 [Acidiferrobacterales bacterium]|nr:hypothetical protein [Acidiferrobacterales bacterium]
MFKLIRKSALISYCSLAMVVATGTSCYANQKNDFENSTRKVTSSSKSNNKGFAKIIAQLQTEIRNLESEVVRKQKKIEKSKRLKQQPVQLGPRPFFLVDDMDEGDLKSALQQCQNGPFFQSDFSIGHRGAPLQFPEHTRESYIAAAKMGAGIMECDVTFTKDRELVCRHSQCDLHTTTDILATPLAQNCSVPFSPADPLTDTAASAQCCTSDITLEEFKTLQGKMDAANTSATTVEEYLAGTPDFRTDLYASRGTLLTHAESIELFKKLGVKFTPELKSPNVEMPYQGNYSQQDYAQQMIDDYISAGVSPKDVWAQSFNLEDVQYWIANNPSFGRQAVYLDSRVYLDQSFVPSLSDFEAIYASGVRIIAPPTFALVTTDSMGEIIPSDYALLAKQAGLDIITWTVERSGLLASGGGFYYSSIADVTNNDGDVFKLIDVLAQDVGVIGIFSDWPATTTYYANCMRFQ